MKRERKFSFLLRAMLVLAVLGVTPLAELNAQPSFMDRMRAFGGDRDRSDSGSSDVKEAAAHVSAVADQQSNSLVISASSELMPDIDELISELDRPTEENTVMEVFFLSYAFAEEMAETITEVFEEDRHSQRAGGRKTERSVQEARVVAVPDLRTNSVIVTASEDSMAQIKELVRKLDENPALDQNVHVYKIENADLESLKEILDGMFDETGTYSSSSSSRTSGSTTPSRPSGGRSSGGGSSGGRSGGGGGVR